MDTLKFVKERNVASPTRAHEKDAGCDWYVPMDLTVEEMLEKEKITNSKIGYIIDPETKFIRQLRLNPGQSVLIPTGIRVNVPDGYAMVYENKSGIASKRSLLVGSSVVDIGYQGICHINLHNVSDQIQEINAGDKIVQSILYKIGFHTPTEVSTTDELYSEKSDRGEGGFGSTGV